MTALFNIMPGAFHTFHKHARDLSVNPKCQTKKNPIKNKIHVGFESGKKEFGVIKNDVLSLAFRALSHCLFWYKLHSRARLQYECVLSQ